jgi:hypothetical protein
MRRFIVWSLLVAMPSLAPAKQPSERKIFPAELTADDAPRPREAKAGIPLLTRTPTVLRLRVDETLMHKAFTPTLDVQTPLR